MINKGLLSFIFIFIFASMPVKAQETTEGRISEHSVVSIIALSGLLIFAHFVRKSRKSNFDDPNS